MTSTDHRDVDIGRRLRDDVDRLLRGQGQDVETVLRIDRSVATGVHRVSIEADSSMLFLLWPDGRGVRSWLLGGGYREIVAASSIPTAVAAIHDEPFARVALVARQSDLIPARTPSLIVAAELVAKLVDRDHPSAIGPLALDEIEPIGVDQPGGAIRLEPGDDIGTWLRSATRAGDLVVAAIDDRITPELISLHEAGRSVLAATYNSARESSLTGSTLTFPVGGSLGPA